MSDDDQAVLFEGCAPRPLPDEDEPRGLRGTDEELQMACDAEPAADLTPELILGDSLAVLSAMAPDSLDSIVCDPPYGLEFMGKDWDKFRTDDPGRVSRWRGDNAGGQGGVVNVEERRVGGATVEFGGGRHHTTSRCTGCGKRDQFRNAHECKVDAAWRTEVIDAYSAPPSSLAFQNWVRGWGVASYKALKPGGHLLAFGGTRMFHRLAAGLEDAGFEVRDCLSWLYGSGFPKSMDVSKALDKAVGAKRPIIGPRVRGSCAGGDDCHCTNATFGATKHAPATAPATAPAKAWAGWGTALKPAWEPIIVARKPLIGATYRNVLEHGTGALNIDGCRVGDSGGTTSDAPPNFKNKVYGRGMGGAPAIALDAGRWPANVVLDEEAAQALDDQSGETVSRANMRGLVGRHDPGQGPEHNRIKLYSNSLRGHNDSGGASRFFYTAKASTADKTAQGDNPHPTVKPVELMRWLVRLVTPRRGTVCDPFMGSGSTGIAARAEGFKFIGIEMDPAYYETTRRRILGAMFA